MNETKTVTVRMRPELVNRLDDARGDVPRVEWIRRSVEACLPAAITSAQLLEVAAS